MLVNKKKIERQINLELEKPHRKTSRYTRNNYIDPPEIDRLETGDGYSMHGYIMDMLLFCNWIV